MTGCQRQSHAQLRLLLLAPEQLQRHARHLLEKIDYHREKVVVDTRDKHDRDMGVRDDKIA